MGRKTYESFGAKPLPGRTNIVITHDSRYQSEGTVVVHSISEALEVAGDVDEVMFIGGASLYEQVLPQADRLYVTVVYENFEGDAWFPEYDSGQWMEIDLLETPRMGSFALEQYAYGKLNLVWKHCRDGFGRELFGHREENGIFFFRMRRM